MEFKCRKEITYSVDDIRALIEKHILDSGISEKGDTYTMQFIVEEESVFTNNTDGWTDYKFTGVKVIQEDK